jgi:hypothetical protein
VVHKRFKFAKIINWRKITTIESEELGIIPARKKKQGYYEKILTKRFFENISQKRFRKFVLTLAVKQYSVKHYSALSTNHSLKVILNKACQPLKMVGTNTTTVT